MGLFVLYVRCQQAYSIALSTGKDQKWQDWTTAHLLVVKFYRGYMYATSLHILQMLFNLSFTICFNIAAVCCHLKSVDFKVKLKAPLQGIHIMITISYKKALFFFLKNRSENGNCSYTGAPDKSTLKGHLDTSVLKLLPYKTIKYAPHKYR